MQKEIRRFMRVPGQTLVQPLISASLYFLVFGVTLGGHDALMDGAPYLKSIVPGLVFLSVSNNAFLNASSSLIITKIQGTMVDLLVAPLSPGELLAGFIGGAMVRGLLVGFATWIVGAAFTDPGIARPVEVLLMVTLCSYTFAVLGVLTGVWAEKFEQINFFSAFLMVPLTFLGGVFYSVRALPEPFRTISLFNPITHMIEGLREGMLGTGQVSNSGVLTLVLVAVAATWWAYRLVSNGFRLKV